METEFLKKNFGVMNFADGGLFDAQQGRSDFVCRSTPNIIFRYLLWSNELLLLLGTCLIKKYY